MTLANTRLQLPVGQGGFHDGRLYDDGDLKFRYVVDCGAMSTYSSSRDACIDAYLIDAGTGAALDYLFITHAHADHVNGLKRLLDAAKGMRVKVIVMPFFNVVDRLISYARTASVDPAAAADAFYRDFTRDPVNAVSRFGPDQIIQVVSSGPEGRAPSSGNDPGPDFDTPQPDPAAPDMLLRMSLKHVGRGSTKVVKVKPVGKGSKKPGMKKPGVWTVEDSTGFMYVSGASTSAKWLLAPYIDPSVEADADAFMDALAVERGISVAALTKWLAKTTNVSLLLTDGLPHLVAAYHAVAKDLNVTSMSLYSGPVPEPATLGVPAPKVFTGIDALSCMGRSHGERGAWLGTGDAALKQAVRREPFFAHYGKLLDEVHTLVLPHHGSEGNFHPELLQRIQPRLCVVAADHYSTWRHPGTRVVQAVASAGRLLFVVTSSLDSRVREFTIVT